MRPRERGQALERHRVLVTMKLGTRLLLPLLAAVAVVMSLYGAWALRQRQSTLVSEARRETRAYATALGLALEGAFRDPERSDVQAIIDRISREPKIYGVLVYGPDARSLFVSDPLRAAGAAPGGVLQGVLARGDTASFEREIEGQAVYSVLHPIRAAGGEVVGAFEVAQPLAFVEAEKARTTQRFLLNTLTLLAALTVLFLWLVRRSLTRPLERFVAAVQALGRGELGHRVAGEGGGGELALLGREFNQMADHLEGARAELVRETEERIALERRLRETEKLAAVGNLAAGLAHEIAAPLHVIRGRAEMLLRRDGVPEAQQRNLRIIVEQIGRITRIVRNLLDFARRREPRMEPLDLGVVLEGVTEFLEPEFARAGVRLVWEGPRTLWTRGDPHLLHQVFINLLVNARQALDEVERGRRIVIRTHLAPAAETEGAGTAGGPSVIIEVEDTGLGMPDEVLPRIFEPFFTTKPGGVGTGLGLAVARSIVEDHGGRLEAENVLAEAATSGDAPLGARPAGGGEPRERSSPRSGEAVAAVRRGARFRVTLPAAPAPEPLHA